METFIGYLFLVSLTISLIQFTLAIVFTSRVSGRPLEKNSAVNAISIVVPFYNEHGRMAPLLHTLNNQKAWPEKLELIFVDDASTDQGADLLKMHLGLPYKLIRLEKKAGKKAAIHEGILKATHDFILTLDADVILPETYAKSVLQLSAADMIILPVNMRANSFSQRLYAIEFSWLQQLTFGSKKPVLCNGANLFFKKSSYLNSVSRRTDFKIPSGDDVFLLEAFVKTGRTIARIYDPELEVETPAPASFSDLLKQRKRWIGKWKHMDAKLNGNYALLMITVQVNFMICLLGFTVYPWFLIPLAIKFFAEIFATVNRDLKDLALCLGLLLLHQIWYPIYLLLLLLPQKKDERWAV